MAVLAFAAGVLGLVGLVCGALHVWWLWDFCDAVCRAVYPDGRPWTGISTMAVERKISEWRTAATRKTQ